jgi:hypothetical protein
MLSFGLLGVNDWAPYASNARFLLLLGFSAYLVRDLKGWQRLICLLFVCSVPLTSRASSRPQRGRRSSAWHGSSTRRGRPKAR